MGLWRNKKAIHKAVCFDNSARYKIDSKEINTLFGIGFFAFPYLENASFGWRYNHILNHIELFVCSWSKEEFVEWHICDLQLKYYYELSIAIDDKRYQFLVTDTITKETIIFETIRKYHKKKWSFPIGLSFATTPPHTITVKMDSI